MKLSVKLRPNAKTEKIERNPLGGYLICVKEPAKEGKANASAIKVLSEHLKIAPSLIKIVSGHASKNKIFEVVK